MSSSSSRFPLNLTTLATVATASAASAGLLYTLFKRSSSSSSSSCFSSSAPSSSSSSSPSPFLHLNDSGQVSCLLSVYQELTEDLICVCRSEYKLPTTAVDRLRRMFDYNIIGGKYNRGCLVLNTLQKVCLWRNLSIEVHWRQGLVLGWCIEILQAMFLVADDVMDSSVTRRGQPCWFRQPDVKLDAVNDSLILESLLYYLLDRHFIGHPNRLAILQLYQTVSMETQFGQMLDLLSVPQGRKDPALFEQFTLETYTRIVTYKTALYTFYLPIASALLLTSTDSSDQLSLARDISIQLGIKFQIEDDFLDCYGAPETIGKIGTDIRDHKCSWLVVQALKKMNAQQRKVLESNYGHDEEQKEERVKELYRELDLESVYNAQEDQSFASIQTLIEKNKKLLPPELFLPILKKIHKRQK